MPGETKSRNQIITDNVRDRFLQEAEEDSEEYYPDDVDRVRDDNWFVKRFVLHYNRDEEKVLAGLKGTLKWRKENRVRDISEASLPIEAFQMGAVFPLNRDKEGHRMVLIRLKVYDKSLKSTTDDSENLMKLFIMYWAEKFEKEDSDKVTVLVDCTDTGLKQMDLDLAFFLLNTFYHHYPRKLAYLLVFDMPWLFNAGWKIIKMALPSNADKVIKFINRTSILEFVDMDVLPAHMGGEIYIDEPWVPESRRAEAGLPPLNEDQDSAISGMDEQENGGPEQDVLQDERQLGQEANAQNWQQRNGNAPNYGSGFGHPSSNLAHAAFPKLSDGSLLDQLLRISPDSVMLFPAYPLDKEPFNCAIVLKNLVQHPVAFKVKTNNLLSYRVWPSCGVIPAGQSMKVVVQLGAGHQCSLLDKFLIVAMLSSKNDHSISEIFNMFKNSPAAVRYRLRCAVIHAPLASIQQIQNSANERTVNEHLGYLENKVTKQMDTMASDIEQMKFLIHLLVLAGILFFLFTPLTNMGRSYFCPVTPTVNGTSTPSGSYFLDWLCST